MPGPHVGITGVDFVFTESSQVIETRIGEREHEWLQRLWKPIARRLLRSSGGGFFNKLMFGP
jgi:hypothetical protein